MSFIGTSRFVHDSGFIYLDKATNNLSEAMAILYGVMYGLSQRHNFNRINLFSDSQWCIFSMTKWMHGWVHSVDENYTMYTTTGPVKNQEVFEQIMTLVVRESFPIKLFHVKGHAKFMTEKARNTFIVSNSIKPTMAGADGIFKSNEVINWISECNDIVDNATRSWLTIGDPSSYDFYIPEGSGITMRLKLTPEVVYLFSKLTKSKDLVFV